MDRRMDRAIKSINPATGDLTETFEPWSDAQLDAVLETVGRVSHDWRNTALEKRESLMKGVAVVLRENADKYARLMAQEMGKPVVQGRAEIEKCGWVCEYYANHAADFLKDEVIESGAGRSYVRFPPLGTILAVMPWNFPFWQVFRFAAPALMAGNTAVLKHASNVPRCAQAIESLFLKAGFPEHVLRNLMIESKQVARVIAHPVVKAATLTGSGPAGSQVAAQSGKMLKKTVLELGGSDPFIVLPDADLSLCAGVAAQARTINSGQSCIAAKRFIILEQVADAFLDLFRRNMEALVVGDPLDEKTQVGPQAREDLLQELHAQVTASVAKGARVLLGGKPLNRPGFYYPPTILEGVTPGMPAFDEELFGPVAAVLRVRDKDEAVRMANLTCYGLGAAVWTRDVRKGEALARRVEAGNVFVNGMVASDPRLPFGGIKASGYGRELSQYGIREFVNIQTIWIK